MYKSEATSVVEFSSHLAAALLQSQNSLPSPCPDALLYIDVLPFIPTDLVRSQRSTLREHAVSIWNSCTAVFLTDDLQCRSEVAKFRALAYLLLASATSRRNRKSVGNLSKIALVAAKDCLQTNNTDLAGKVLECEADINGLLNEKISTEGEQEGGHSYKIEFWCLRVLLHWKRQRLDLADHCYAAIPDLLAEAEAPATDKVVDLCYEIARERSSAVDYNNAERWFNRASSITNLPDRADSYTGSDIRLNVLHSFAQMLLRIPNNHDTFRQATDIIETLHKEYGSKLSICLLGLEARLNSAKFNPGPALAELERVANTAHLIKTTHSTIMHYITELSPYCYSRAAEYLKNYIIHRLIPEGNVEWIEDGIVNYINLFSNNDQGHSSEILSAFSRNLNHLSHALGFVISPRAAQAAHTLIWRMMRETYDAGLESVALLWCQLGLHHIFASAGEGSMAKLERQLIGYYLQSANHGAAYQVLDQMSFTRSNNKHSRFLAYCTAIRTANDKDAQSCLNTIVNTHGENEQLLLACVGESLQHDRLFDTVRLLQRILEGRLQEPEAAMEQDALFKFTCQMLINLSACHNDKDEPRDEVLVRLCTLFKSVVKLHRKMRNDTPGQHCAQTELDYAWFRSKSFDLGRNMAKLWPRRFTVDLLQYSNQLHQIDDDNENESNLSSRSKQYLRDSTYIQIALYAAEARQVAPSYTIEDLPQTSYDQRNKPKTSDCRITLYERVLKLFTQLREQYEVEECYLDEALKDAQLQLHMIIPVAFEALLFLSANAYLSDEAAFDEISIQQFLKNVAQLAAPPATYALVADILLTFASGDSELYPLLNGLRIPSISAARLLGQIIQTLRSLESYNSVQASRWVRCVTQLILDDVEVAFSKHHSQGGLRCDQSLTMLESVVQQVLGIVGVKVDAQEARVVELDTNGLGARLGPHPYPPEELQWLATKLFNMSIDFYAFEIHDIAQKWAAKALEVARVVEANKEGGSTCGLADLLQKKISELELDVIEKSCSTWASS